ncbi:MAG: hypothetical protein JWQ34_1395 [Mucilaginibacter sp.]|nr:hypothetical protein [Mucilaginibacter sp.]
MVNAYPSVRPVVVGSARVAIPAVIITVTGLGGPGLLGGGVVGIPAVIITIMGLGSPGLLGCGVVVIPAVIITVTGLGGPGLLGGARVSAALGLVLSLLAKCGGDSYNYYSDHQ